MRGECFADGNKELRTKPLKVELKGKKARLNVPQGDSHVLYFFVD